MKTFLFLIQVKSGLPFKYRCLKSQSCVLLSYGKESKQTHIYAPNTTWTQGRNLLYEYVKTHHLNYDYYIFLDEDLMFEGVSQKQGFTAFLSVLEAVDFPIVIARPDMICVPVFFEEATSSKQVLIKFVENLNCELQTIDWFDSCFYAISHQAFFANTILPYIEKYDSDSWWNSGCIFVLKANYYYRNRIIQFNTYIPMNTQNSEYPRGFSLLKKIYAELLNELNVSAIEMSSRAEVVANVQLPDRSPLDQLDYMVDVVPFRLASFLLFIKRVLRIINNSLKSRSAFLLYVKKVLWKMGLSPDPIIFDKK